MNEMLQTLGNLSALQALGFFLGLNLVTVLASAGFCWLLGQVFRHRRLFDRWEPFRRIEFLAVLSTIGINAITSVAGWLLWQHGFITLASRSLPGLIIDLLLMVVVMDLGMYFLHRSAHWRPLYPTLHAFHHRHEATNPVSLFILHPFEVFGFAALMTGFLVFYDMDARALIAYLTLNVLWGTIGHSGVEPFPRFVTRIPLLNLVGTSTFHEHLPRGPPRAPGIQLRLLLARLGQALRHPRSGLLPALRGGSSSAVAGVVTLRVGRIHPSPPTRMRMLHGDWRPWN